MERIIPDWDRLALKIIPAPTEVNGIAIPEQARERPQQAFIVAVGPDCSVMAASKHPRAKVVPQTVVLGKQKVGLVWGLDGQTYGESEYDNKGRPITNVVPKYRVGDKVFVGRFSGTDITQNFMDSETWIRIIRESEILARVID